VLDVLGSLLPCLLHLDHLVLDPQNKRLPTPTSLATQLFAKLDPHDEARSVHGGRGPHQLRDQVAGLYLVLLCHGISALRDALLDEGIQVLERVVES